jgi:outer membrane protein TolC
MQEGVLDVGRPGETYFGVSTTLEFPGRRGLRIDIANRENEEVRALVAMKSLDLSFEVKEAFFNLLFEGVTRDLAQQNLSLVEKSVDLATTRFETGDVGRVEVLRAQVELAGAANALHSAENSEQIAAARLAFLIGRDPSEPITVEGDFPRPEQLGELETMLATAAASRPELFGLRTALDREGLAEKQAKRGRLPDLDLGVANHQIDGEGSFWDVTLSVPIPLFQQQFRGEAAEARARQDALRHELSYRQSQIAFEVRASYQQALTARERLDLYSETLLAEARELFEMYMFSYQQGEINGLELNAARLSLVDTYTGDAEAVYDYAMAVATLERAVGREAEGALK